MLSKKKLITGASTLVLGISVVGAAYALPMTNTPMSGQNTDAAKATVTMKQSDENAVTPMSVNTMKQNATEPMAEVNIEDMQEAMSKTMPAGQAMNQQTMNDYMNQNTQQMTQHYEQMQQNHQQMTHNHQGMAQNHQTMSGSAMTGQPMGSGHMGFHK